MFLRRDERADDAADLHEHHSRSQRSTMPTTQASVGRLGGQKRKRGFLAAHEEHVLADAGAHGVDRDERAAGRLAVGRHGLQHEELVPVERARP